MNDFKYNRDLMFLVRKKLRHVRQITKEATRTPTTDPRIPGPSMTGATHNYFVLEKHERDTGNIPTGTENNENPYYSSPLIADIYEDADAVRETSFGTTESSARGNVYNSFKQFQQQQDEYDHLDDHKKRLPPVTDNAYGTTQNVMTIPAKDDTYHHLGQFSGATSRPDSVYGMPRVNDYDYAVSGTQASATVRGGTNIYSTVNNNI